MSSGTHEDTPGRRLAGGAFAFLRAAELLHEADPASWAWATCYVNIGFAIELALKGFLRERGGLEKEQQHEIRHDLSEAYCRAINRGFQPSHPLQKPLVDDLTPHFKDMSLRYLTGEWIELPSISEAIGVARLLILDVHEQCGFIR